MLSGAGSLLVQRWVPREFGPLKTFSPSEDATRTVVGVDVRLNKLAGSDLMPDLGHGT